MLEGDWKSECDDRINAYDDWVKENGVKWMLQEYGIQSDMHSLETRMEYIAYLLDKVEACDVPYCNYAFTADYPFRLYDGQKVVEPEIVRMTVGK